jgi:hypothetical protein
MAGSFIKQIERARQAAKEPASTEAKPTEEMSDAELEEAITATRRKLLDAQHAELRKRESARVTGAGEAAERPRASGLAEVLGNLQKRKRRSWR